MGNQYIGAIDQGTTSTRFILFDSRGMAVASHQMEHRQIYPQPGWVEHDPLEIWGCTREVIKATLRQSGIDARDIAAIGVTNQRETTVVWDRNTGKPFCNAIVWQCLRTRDICLALSREGGQDRFRGKVGLPLSPYFSGPKIKWICDNVPGVRTLAECGDALFGNMDTWLIWWLTGGPGKGVHVTDVTNASRTMLMNLETLDWDREILDVLGIPRQMLPEIRPSSDPRPYGHTDKDGPFGAAIPICGDLGDQQAALVGQTCFELGDAKNTYGTGCFLLLNTGTRAVPSTHGLITSVAYKMGNAPAVYCLEAPIAMAGSVVQWLRDNLRMFDRSSEVETLARTVTDNGGVYLVPAFSGLLAPYWDPCARGLLAGLTGHSNRGHIARAALEATAYQSCDLLRVMEDDSGVKLSRLKVDGGMVVNELLMQFQADILGIPVVRPQVTETTALGAAYAAGLAVGVWNSTDQVRANWAADKTWQPDMNEETRQSLYAGWRKAVERSLGWAERNT
ncbi:MAG: glycerol kinase [Chloroflexi bacterium RBG_16_57_8]|nr:MAG: glycerol kinase [Chloroflexi bacterium RBG_16_57_8]